MNKGRNPILPFPSLEQISTDRFDTETIKTHIMVHQCAKSTCLDPKLNTETSFVHVLLCLLLLLLYLGYSVSHLSRVSVIQVEFIFYECIEKAS